METIKLLKGDNRELLKTLEDNSIDSVVTDPPYGLSFMNKKWDYDVPSVELWKEVLRVLKPGGHVLSFGGTRTYHRMVVNMEDAGFEIRDSISYMYGSGFPKSHNIGKAVDKLNGNEREVVGTLADIHPRYNSPRKGGDIYGDGFGESNTAPPLTKGNSEWEGWGTSLKPSMELICLARKPLSEKSIAENVLKHGTGGINIDDCRVKYTSESDGWGKRHNKELKEWNGGRSFTHKEQQLEQNDNGRFPANTILECICDEVIPGEIWKEVVGYENYSVSNLGNVKNTNGDMAKLQETNNGYLSISLYKDGKYNNKLVHRLVGEAFIENPENKKTINHIDGNKTNNCVDNLEWATYKENNTHALENGLRTTSNNKPVGQYDLDGNLLNEYSSATEASKETGITRSKITDVCLGTQIKSKTSDKTYTAKTAGGYVWKHLPECPCYILDKQSKGSSRFFYTAKVSKKERNMGLDETPDKILNRVNSGGLEHDKKWAPTITKNHHPTLKPVNLMTYLCRLITPPNGVVLDMYMGSGSTGISALIEGFNFIGMEMDEDYFNIAEARINNYEKYRQFVKK